MAASPIHFLAFFGGSTMLAQHTQSMRLLCDRPAALELFARQLERSGRDNFRRLLKTNLFTPYRSIYHFRDVSGQYALQID